MSGFKELELETFDLSEETEQARLRGILKQMNGVHTARITRGGVHIIFNSRAITSQEIAGVVKRAGFNIGYEQRL